MRDEPGALAKALGTTECKTIKGLIWASPKNPGGWSIKKTNAMHWLQHSSLKSARAAASIDAQLAPHRVSYQGQG